MPGHSLDEILAALESGGIVEIYIESADEQDGVMVPYSYELRLDNQPLENDDDSARDLWRALEKVERVQIEAVTQSAYWRTVERAYISKQSSEL